MHLPKANWSGLLSGRVAQISASPHWATGMSGTGPEKAFARSPRGQMVVSGRRWWLRPSSGPQSPPPPPPDRGGGQSTDELALKAAVLGGGGIVHCALYISTLLSWHRLDNSVTKVLRDADSGLREPRVASRSRSSPKLTSYWSMVQGGHGGGGPLPL